MTRVLIFSDTQLDARSSLLPAGERLRDQDRMLQSIAGAAAARHVDAVIFGGDAFQHRRPVPAELLTFDRFVRQLASYEIPLFAVAGNHDWLGPDQPIALDLFDDGPVRVLKTPQLLQVGALMVGVLPWAPAASMLAAAEVDRDLVDARVAERLVDVAEGLHASIEKDGRSTLLVAHWMLSGSAFPSGLPVSQAREPILQTRDLIAQGWDYVVAGHVHKSQILSDLIDVTGFGAADKETLTGQVRAVVCGSPWVCDFGEAELEHGYWILDSIDGLEFSPVITDRRFITVDLPEIAGVDGLDVTDMIVAAIALPLDDAVVRIRFTVTEEQLALVDVDAIRRFVDDAGGRVHEIRPTVLRETRARAEGVDEHLSTLEALDLYVAAHDVAAATAEPMRDRTRSYLEALA